MIMGMVEPQNGFQFFKFELYFVFYHQLYVCTLVLMYVESVYKIKIIMKRVRYWETISVIL